MAARNKSSSSSYRRRSDRISDLTDDVLGHVLSFLPTKEAARAAVLARRWRHVFGSVSTISFEEKEGEREDDWYTFYADAEEMKSCSAALLDDVGAALLCRRRCAAGHGVPLRAFHFAFDSWHWWDKVAVDEWLTYLLRHRRHHQELHLDLRFCIRPVCPRADGRDRRGGGGDDDMSDTDSDSDDEEWTLRWRYILPRRLFSCTALRALCVSYCRLKLPEAMAIDLPLLETLRLTGLGDSGTSIQRLISSCPSLADLTLEALCKLNRVTVVDTRLRRFALRCCHNLRNVSIDTSELRSLEYAGGVPADSVLSLHGSPAIIPFYTIGFCRALSKEAEFVRFTRFLEKISDAKHLHLHLHHRSLESKYFQGFPLFSSLTRLTLQGLIGSCYTIDAVRRILEQTPNLEVLSLRMEEPKHEPMRTSRDEPKLILPDDFVAPDRSSFSIRCLQRRVRQIHMENYMGVEPEKMLAKLLLRSALVLERLCVVFPKGPSALEDELKRKLKTEIESWGVANSEKIFL